MREHLQCGKCGAKADDKHEPNCFGRKVKTPVYGRADFNAAKETGFNERPVNIRCFDNGGPDNGGSCDRYTIIRTTPVGFYSDSGARDRWFSVYFDISASAQPFHPQGIGMTGETKHRPLWNAGKWGGVDKRSLKFDGGLEYRPVRWRDLPVDVRQCAWQLAFDDNEP